MKRRTMQLFLLAALSSSGALAQINCASGSSASNTLVCQIPFATGLLTNDTALGGGQTSPSAQQAATIFNSAIATQVSQLPLATASAGTVVLFKGGVPVTFNNLGPILTDRAPVLGRGKVFLGFTASQYVFTDIDGIALGNLAFGFSSQACNPPGTSGSCNVVSTTYTTETTKLAFKVNQYVAIATVGLTKRVDASVIVPVQRVSLGATTLDSQSYIQNTGSTSAIGPLSNPSVYTSGTASGIGDIVFIGKGELWVGEHGAVSAALSMRTPTGDDRNFLGSGAWGFNPYLVYSYLAKVSPHAKIGYVWNTTTELNNPTGTPGENQALPGGIDYDFGADYAALKGLTLAGDLLGNQYLDAPVLVLSSTNINGVPAPIRTTVTDKSSYSINNLSAGLKVSPVGNLVLSGNVLVQLNNNGLRSRPTPLIGISFKF
jgi:hypothetical protein